MANIKVEVDNVTYLKLIRGASILGLTRDEAVRLIASKGAAFFLRKLVGATKSRA